MQSEALCPPAQRYLTLAARLTSTRYAAVREGAVRWCAANREKLTESNIVALDMLRTTELSANVVALVTYGCYADVPRGRFYTAAFKFSNASEMTKTIAKLRFGIYWHRLPTESLEHGHHQVAVIEFPEGMPSLFEGLPLCNESTVNTPSQLYLGLTDVEDWKAICELMADA